MCIQEKSRTPYKVIHIFTQQELRITQMLKVQHQSDINNVLISSVTDKTAIHLEHLTIY